MGAGRTPAVGPYFGYLYTRDGYYGPPTDLRTEGQLERFMNVLARQAMDERREVRVTDADDCLVFHSQHGKVLWPPEEGEEEVELETFADGDPVMLRPKYQQRYRNWPYPTYAGVVISATRLLVVVDFGGKGTALCSPWELERRTDA